MIYCVVSHMILMPCAENPNSIMCKQNLHLQDNASKLKSLMKNDYIVLSANAFSIQQKFQSSNNNNG